MLPGSSQSNLSKELSASTVQVSKQLNDISSSKPTKVHLRALSIDMNSVSEVSGSCKKAAAGVSSKRLNTAN